MKGGIPAQNVKSSVELTTRISVLGDLELKWRSAGCVPPCLYIHVTSPRQGVDETFPRISWVYPFTLGSFRYDSAPFSLAPPFKVTTDVTTRALFPPDRTF